MSIRSLILCAAAAPLLFGSPAFAQRQQSQLVSSARERARPVYETGVEQLRLENLAAAVTAFHQATELDPTFDMAYYMLGRTHMAMKNYASAIAALTKCRDLHLGEASMQFVTKQEVQRIRRERIGEIEDRIAALQPKAGDRRVADEIRMLEERKRQIADAERQITAEKAVPAYVSLALGSALFRAGRMAEAEQAYVATVAADPKVGEAHNNLAVVYLETGRYAEAEKAVKAAEAAGLRVQPALKEEIVRRKKGTL
jgi:tetratricopeptide (TPR) repeat protein